MGKPSVCRWDLSVGQPLAFKAQPLLSTDISKAVKKLQQKGYVEWHTDDKKERTYITPTTKAVSEMHGQKESLVSAYSKIIANIDGEDLKTTIDTLAKIRKILGE